MPLIPSGHAMMPTPAPPVAKAPDAPEKAPASNTGVKWTKGEILLSLKHIAMFKPSVDNGDKKILTWPKKFEIIHQSILEEDSTFRYSFYLFA